MGVMSEPTSGDFAWGESLRNKGRTDILAERMAMIERRLRRLEAFIDNDKIQTSFGAKVAQES